MQKYIQINEETLKALVSGKCVEGSLHRDQWTGEITFKPYNRLSRNHKSQDVMLYRSTNGWLKESRQRRKMWISVPKNIGMCRDAVALLAESREMAEFLHERGEEMEGGLV
ncbi:MAG: hypothetical protein IKZ62_06350 [Prevotella sp.]|nr:hypothetical protein [Prevotella sp.]